MVPEVIKAAGGCKSLQNDQSDPATISITPAAPLKDGDRGMHVARREIQMLGGAMLQEQQARI